MRADDWALAVDNYHISKMFGGQWDMTVLALLRGGPLRPRDLARMVSGARFHDRWHKTETKLSPARITETLRVLTEVGLVRRTALSDGWDRAVEYSLTPAGEDLLPVLEQAQSWLRRHAELFEREHRGVSSHRRANKQPRRMRVPGSSSKSRPQ